MRILGMQAEYLEEPIRVLPENAGIELDLLPISLRLKSAIRNWDASFQNEDQDDEFVLTGRVLARELQQELGKTWTVRYLDNADVSLPLSGPETHEAFWSAD